MYYLFIYSCILPSQFVAHANIQQLLATVWYDGMPGFKRLAPFKQLIEIVKIGTMFPLYCLAYLFAPNTKFGSSMKKPFIKFIVHSASYLFFLSMFFNFMFFTFLIYVFIFFMYKNKLVF